MDTTVNICRLLTKGFLRLFAFVSTDESPCQLCRRRGQGWQDWPISLIAHKSLQLWSTKGCPIKPWFLSTCCYPLLGWFVGWPAYSDVPRGQAKRMAIIYNLMAARKFWNSRQNILIYSGHPLVDTGDSLGRALVLHRSLFPTAVSSDSRNLVKIPSLRARPHLWKQTQGFWGRGWGIRLKPQMVEAQRKLRPSVSWDNIWGGWAALRRNIVAQHKQQAQAQSSTSNTHRAAQAE